MAALVCRINRAKTRAHRQFGERRSAIFFQGGTVDEIGNERWHQALTRSRGCPESLGAENAAIAFDFRGRAERLVVVVGKFHRRLAATVETLQIRPMGSKSAPAGRIAAAEIVGQKSSPTGAETNAASGGSLPRIVEIGGTVKVRTW